MLGKMPKLQGTAGKFLIKNAVLGVPRWKRPKLVSIRSLVFVVAEMFLEVALFLETSYVLKNVWVHMWFTSWLTWLADKSNFWTFTLSAVSYSYISLFESLIFIHMTPRISIKGLVQFKHKCTCLFATNLKNKQ